MNVSLPAGTGISLKLAMERYVYSPTVEMPWSSEEKTAFIRGRED